jgi:FkbM family methyltransferase
MDNSEEIMRLYGDGCGEGQPWMRDRIIGHCQNGVESLRRNRFVLNIIRSLHIQRLMKLLYFEIFAPKNRQKVLVLDNTIARFHVINYEELRALEIGLNRGVKAERRVLRTIMATIKSGDAVYDVGANIGLHTVFAAINVGEGGQVLSFEPENKAYDALQRNVRLNGLKNVKIMKVALGNKKGRGRLYNRPKIGIGASSLLATGDSEFRQEVQIWPGDYLVEHEKLPIPRVVKIDVEGVECDVIQGLEKTLSQKGCQLVCCEIHPALSQCEGGCAKVLSQLAALGFSEIKTFWRGGEVHAFCYKR